MGDGTGNKAGWAGLSHAYGPAVDTAERLRELADPDMAVRTQAVDYLWGAVLHQGTIYPATAPVVAAVCQMLEDWHADPLPVRLWPAPDDEPVLVHGQLLLFLAAVAASVQAAGDSTLLAAVQCPPGAQDLLGRLTDGTWDGDDAGTEAFSMAMRVFEARSVLACRAHARTVVQAVQPWLWDAQQPVWQAAAAALSRWAAILGDPAVTAVVAHRLTGAASRAAADADRALWVLALGELGVDTARFLADSAAPVRACAALSAPAGNRRALAELLAALAMLPDCDYWLPRGCPFITGWFRFTLIKAAIAQGATFGELLPAAVKIAATSGPFTVDYDWGPLLRAAFPTPPAEGTRLSGAQRLYLHALADNDALWNTNIANGTAYLKRLGLPATREGLRQLAR